MRTQTDVTGEWSRPVGKDPRSVRIVDTPAQGAVDVRIPVDAPILLGRDPGPKGLALMDPRVSSVHLTLYPGDAGDVLFRDMGSKNGTFHNGRRALGGRLDEGDVLRLGSTLLVMTRRGPGVDCEAPERGFVGQSPRFREACARASEAARTPAPVLLLGESGSGKEGMARFVHDQSGRRGPFIAVNCATLHDHMATAALFGHERGAFTGATVSRRGHFREAEGGTLFLDEIGDLPLDIQPRLLRALEREITPVGAARPLTVDVRVVAATNADLSARVVERRFRGDLFARLNGCPIELAPLRARKEDILRLARHFCGHQPARVPFGDPVFEADLAEVLLLYRWPFNARELRQVVEWLHLDGHLPLPFDRLPRRIIDAAVPPAPPGGAPEELEHATRTAPLRVAEAHRRRVRPSKEELEQALESHGYNISAVARAFDRDRKQIYRWVELYDIPLPGAPDTP
ncbi:MAG: Fis family transcriptional regulator [Deltaproteobacteria bacterium HGW-Deltaproteobacteria-14]|jgi:DNA-binding NtrC family response regulator|nr:MAG: Fis family transcriptional regulator [Deltaproteobacteria bacterium HGW-Deltaproteobacteria-14]